ncbi:MAG TPA: exonuclease domain-containing protein [Candidatus Paceibacterota bacterium]|nr:exonuclease domain-containing protein [Candidatus Paceibacterota bacterium]
MIIVDVETTGVYPDRHSIVSIGAVDFAFPANYFYKECRPFDGAEIEAESLERNGFSHEELADPSRPSLFTALQDFIAWARECPDMTIAGANAFFDRDFLRSAAERFHLEWPFGQRIVDLHSVCYAHMAGRGKRPPMKGSRADLTNDHVLTYVGLPPETFPHHSLTGARMEAEAFSRLLHSRPLFQDLEQHPLPEWASDSGGQRNLF